MYTSIPHLVNEMHMELTMSFLEDHYPWDNEAIDVALCISHKLREELAQRLNQQQARRALAQGLEVVLVKPSTEPKMGASMAPHPEMEVWQGQPLIGCRRDSVRNSVLNGCMYKVVNVDATKVVVRLMEGTAELTLTHQQCIQGLRLACARTYAGVQGLTLTNKRLLLLQTRHESMDWRKLYVACSRVTSGALLHIPTPEQERVHWSLERNIHQRIKRPAPELETRSAKVFRFE
jgi:hypothetical protein